MQRMKRVKGLDYANVIAMLAVVWFHVPSTVEAPIRHLEYISVNIPFFLLSGYTFALAHKEQLGVRPFLMQLGRSLLVPTCFFYAFFYLLWLLVGRQMAGDTEMWYVPLAEFAQGQFNVVLATYWFIICLCVMNLIYYALSKSGARLLTALVCGCLPMLLLLVPVPGEFRIREACAFIPFFAIGATCSHWHESQSAYIEILLCLLGLAAYCLVQERLALGSAYQWNEILSGLALCCVVCLLAKFLCRFSILDGFAGTLRYGALVLLATQNYIIGVVKGVADISNLVYKPLVIVLVYAITYPLILLIKNKMPFILGKKQ